MIYVYNIAIRRPDGKVECDTVFREGLATADEVKQIARHFQCDVILSCVGTFEPADGEFAKQHSFYSEYVKEDLENAEV
jgi:hypothetical protein